MDKRRLHRAVEWGKDVLIAVLAVSAVWLAIRAQSPGVLGLFAQSAAGSYSDRNTAGSRTEAVRPLRMTVNLGQEVHYAQLCDTAAGDELFQSFAGLLMETLSSAGQPTQADRDTWERAVAQEPGVTFDFQGEVPMSVLSQWLSGSQSPQEAAVRRLTMSVSQDQVALTYRDERTGTYYRRWSTVVNHQHLREALEGYSGNGVAYAFESEAAQLVDPDTLLPAQDPTPKIYTADTPTAGGQSALEALMEDMDIPAGLSSFYRAGDEWVGRSGNDSFRLSDAGVLVYTNEEGSDLFQTEGAGLPAAAECSRRLAAAALSPRMGAARLYLVSAAESAGGYDVSFAYHLDGVPVLSDSGPAAQFRVENGRVTSFTLRLRRYTDSGETAAVLPLRQAAAALAALDRQTAELLLTDADRGGDRIVPGWSAVYGQKEG